MKIVVAEIFGLEQDQTSRLNGLGDVKFIKGPARSKKEKLERLKDADIICGETEPVVEVIYDLRDKLISFPFVGVGWLDLKQLTQNNVKIANAPGCNKAAVSEWIIGMMILLSRRLLKYIGIDNISKEEFMAAIPGIAGKKVAILGKGNVGSMVGDVCEALEANVFYFKRGDDVLTATKDADFVVNCLSNNEDTKGLLNEGFFNSLKEGIFFISITDTDIFDVDSLIKHLDSGKIAGAAIDPAGASIFDAENETYKILKKNPKIITTPHIAFHADMTTRVANDIMIDNVEAWIKGKPINIVN